MEPTPWLTADEQRAWRALIGLVTRLPGVLDAQLQRDSGLTNFDYLVLSALSEHPERTLTMSRLAGVSRSSLSRLSHVVAKLEKRGWVERTPSTRDGRTTLAVLTDDGMRAVQETAPGHVAAVRSIVFDGLDDEQVEQLHAIAATMLERLPDQQGAQRGGADASCSSSQRFTSVPHRKPPVAPPLRSTR